MAKLPKPTIWQKIDEIEFPKDKRGYLGYSGLGSSCRRKIWYSFRWAYDTPISNRARRIFERGDIEEQRIIDDLERVGAKVHSDQLEVVGFGGHVKGHIDGIVVHPEHGEEWLLEMKTAKNSNFNGFVKKGVKRQSNTYYVQLQMYMGKLNLKKALFVVTNKDNEERYFEEVDFDKDTFEAYEKIAEDIICMETPPEKLGERTWFECKYCNYRSICHDGVTPNKNCRTCKKADLEDGGKFSCSSTKEVLSLDKQKIGCEDYDELF